MVLMCESELTIERVADLRILQIDWERESDKFQLAKIALSSLNVDRI
jgi:hypothetical protein